MPMLYIKMLSKLPLLCAERKEEVDTTHLFQGLITILYNHKSMVFPIVIALPDIISASLQSKVITVIITIGFGITF